MSNQNIKKSFVKSKTFIIFTALASIFFVVFLTSVIMMGIRYYSCNSIIVDYMNNTKVPGDDSMTLYEKAFEEGLIWKYFLLPEKDLSVPFIEISETSKLALSAECIAKLKTSLPNWNMNLVYTIMTIIFVFAFVITAFVPLGYGMIILGEKNSAKKLLKKQQKEQKLEVKGN